MAKAAEIVTAFGGGDVAAVLGAFDPVIEWNDAESFFHADRNPYIGPQFAHVWHVRDGRIVRFQQYTDTAQWVKAAGR